VTIEDNRISELNDGSRYDVFDGGNEGRDATPFPGSAVGVDGADPDEVTVRHDDLLAPNGAENKDGSAAPVAECNWWGDRSGPTHPDNQDGSGTWALGRGGAAVDYTPWLTAPAPSNRCRGGTKRGGGPPK